MPANDIVIPEDLLRGRDEDKQFDKYEVMSGTDAGVGDIGDSYRFPVVQIPSSAPKDHGGSMGFDATKPFSTVVRSKEGSFVIGDLRSLSPALQQQVSERMLLDFNSSRDKNKSYSKIMFNVLSETLACTFPDGRRLQDINTWVNDQHDPFGREVRLPPPAITYQNQRKAANMQNGFVSHAGMPAAHPFAGVQPQNNYFPHSVPPANQFGPPAPSYQPPSPTRLTPPPAPATIPAPDKVVMFQFGAGSITSNFHFADVVNQDTIIAGQPMIVTYIVLVRNRAAAGAGDQFMPQTPAPGTYLGIMLPDGTMYQVHQVMLSYSIKTVDHIILLAQLPAPPQPIEPLYSAPEELVDPSPLGQAAPMTAEDAAIQM